MENKQQQKQLITEIMNEDAKDGLYEQPGTLRIHQRKFVIDFDKVKTVEDVVVVLKGMNISVWWYEQDCPEQFKEIYDKGFLIEDKNY